MARATTRRSAGEWARLVREWKRSGLTAAKFAAASGVSAQTLTWWRWRLRQRRPSETRDREREHRQEGVQLVPVEVVEDRAADRAPLWELVTPSGLTLRVYGSGTTTLRDLVGSLVRGEGSG